MEQEKMKYWKTNQDMDFSGLEFYLKMLEDSANLITKAFNIQKDQLTLIRKEAVKREQSEQGRGL